MNNGLLIAFIAVLAFFAVFMIATYFILRKTFKFNIDKNEIVIKNAGSYIKIVVDKRLVKSFFMPNLIKGETYLFNVGGDEYVLKCKSNSFGPKLQMQVFKQDTLIADNGVKL